MLKFVRWSLGVLIFEMLCGFTPFWDGGSTVRIYENILRGRVKYPPYIHPDATDLLQRLITSDLMQRFGNLYGGSQDIMDHAWFAEVTWDRLARKDIDAPWAPPLEDGADTSQYDRFLDEPDVEEQSGYDRYVRASTYSQEKLTYWLIFSSLSDLFPDF